jgi:YVTN family beta-propeller protein
MTDVALPAELEPGSHVDEYRIDAIAGRGGMGVVYRATQERLDRPVALKVIAPTLAGDERFRDRFAREAALAGAIDHPNVVPVYGAGDADGRLFLAMRWVDGDDLRALVERDGALEPATAVEVVVAVAGALDAAHRRGLVHRDVKPANILVGEHVYLGDFGLARDANDDGERGVTKTGQFVGTVEYIAPEQVLGKPASTATDVYGLGCVLFFALTGRSPFGARSDYEMMTAHLEEAPPRVIDLVPSVPAALDAVVARALEKDPDDRFATAGDLATAARSALTGPATAVPPPPRMPKRRTEEPARRRGPIAAVAGVAVIAAAAAALALTSGGSESTAPAPSKPDAADSAGISVAPEDVADAAKGVVAAARAATQPEPAAPVASIPVGDGPEGIAADGDTIWVANSKDDTLARIDPAKNAVVGTPLKVGPDPDGIAAGSGIAYVASFADGTLQRIDGRGETPVPGAAETIGGGAEGVALGKQLVWAVSSKEDTVVRFDRASGQRVGAPIGVGDEPIGVHVGENGVWVTNARDGSVSHIDAATSEVLGTTPVGREPRGVVEAAGSVWVANSADGTVSRIDAATGRPNGEPIRVGRNPRELAAGAGAIWVANHDDNTVSRIDARTGRLVGQPIAVGREPLGVAFAADAVWVANHGDGTVTRIRP